ncbi:MAG: hypothetical protein WAO21_12270 [Verrucomicrobiia bacterium]|jgi:hypothetical protein
MDTDFIEKTIRTYAQTLQAGNETEKEAADELARIADKLRQKRQIEKVESKYNHLPKAVPVRPASSL